MVLLITFLLSYFIFHVCYVRALVETLSKMLSSFSNINALPVPMLRQVSGSPSEVVFSRENLHIFIEIKKK